MFCCGFWSVGFGRVLLGFWLAWTFREVAIMIMCGYCILFVVVLRLDKGE